MGSVPSNLSPSAGWHENKDEKNTYNIKTFNTSVTHFLQIKITTENKLREIEKKLKFAQQQLDKIAHFISRNFDKAESESIKTKMQNRNYWKSIIIAKNEATKNLDKIPNQSVAYIDNMVRGILDDFENGSIELIFNPVEKSKPPLPPHRQHQVAKAKAKIQALAKKGEQLPKKAGITFPIKKQGDR